MSARPHLRLTPEDLLTRADDWPSELVNGELVELHVSKETSALALIINASLFLWVKARGLGTVFQNDCGLQIFSDPSKVRFADGSYVSRQRLESVAGGGHLTVAPDLVLEVVSPHDNAEIVETKIQEYLGAGVRMVWVVYPATRVAYVFGPERAVRLLSPGDALEGGDVLPGFSLPLKELFD